MKRSFGLAAAALVALSACTKKKSTTTAIQTAPVTRQDIIVDVEATGVIQPVNAVQVRSKASGQITNMPVQLGSQVKPGDLLVQIDPRQVRNLYNQAKASLEAAKANLEVTKTQLDRAQGLAKEGVITAPELETAQLNYANAQSQVASANTSLDNAQIALEDATIRAPITGTVIEKDVSLGQVISSATNSPNGGTLLLQMADLNQVMDSTLVSESDIGNVKPGLTATVKVDAYPNRAFHGVVQKIAPQATIQQSVTMFPVLIALDNHDAALLPGMNSDVSILEAQQDNALAIPIDAVRTPREAGAAATALGLDPAKVQQDVQAQLDSRRGANVGRGETAAAPGALASNPGTANDPPGPQGAQGGMPGASAAKSAQCDSLQATFQKHPEIRTKIRDVMQKVRDGSLERADARKQTDQIYQDAKIDPRAVRTCMAGRRGGPGGGPSFSSGGAEQLTIGNTPPHPGLVFVQQGATFAPRVVTLGVSNYDVAQVISGLQEGDKVALITAAMLQQSRTQFQQRIQSRVGLPGVQQQQPAARRGGGGGGRGG